MSKYFLPVGLLIGFMLAELSGPIFHHSPLNSEQVALASSNQAPPQQTTSTNTIIFPLVHKPMPVYPSESSWPMVAANPERTSWAPEGISGYLHLEWYRTVEAYIPSNIQIIAAYGKLFISTDSGLYALDAATGNLVWRYDTELPLGNSASVYGGVVYVGGYDRTLHALDAATGIKLWSFDEAEAGYDTNPLVIDGMIGPLSDQFVGPNALALGYGDPVALAKLLLKFAQDKPQFFKIKAGALGDQVLTAQDVEALSKLPAREVLLAQLLGVLQGVPTALVTVLSGVLRNLMNVLAAIKDQKGGGEEAPVEAAQAEPAGPEAPAADAAAADAAAEPEPAPKA